MPTSGWCRRCGRQWIRYRQSAGQRCSGRHCGGRSRDGRGSGSPAERVRRLRGAQRPTVRLGRWGDSGIEWRRRHGGGPWNST